MRRLTLCVVGVVMALAPATAHAHHRPGHEPQTPCAHGNPTDLCGGDIAVVAEPAGANCPTGGIKVTIAGKVFFMCDGATGPSGPAASSVSVTAEPAGVNCASGGIKITVPNGAGAGDDETFYVCNGLDGQPGAAGPAGPGATGLALPAGAPAPAGPAGPQGAPGTTVVVRPRSCVSRRVVTIRLPKAYSNVKRVGALVAGKRRVLRVNSRRQVRVSFVGLQRPGVTAVVIRRKPRPEVKRFYALCGIGSVGGVNVPPRPTPN